MTPKSLYILIQVIYFQHKEDVSHGKPDMTIAISLGVGTSATAMHATVVWISYLCSFLVPCGPSHGQFKICQIAAGPI